MGKYVNLTPHPVVIHWGEDGELRKVCEPSGNLVRVASEDALVGYDDLEGAKIPSYIKVFGEVEGLPDKQPDTIMIVSGLVRAAVPWRSDLRSPGDLIRDAEGTVTGCEGLIR